MQSEKGKSKMNETQKDQLPSDQRVDIGISQVDGNSGPMNGEAGLKSLPQRPSKPWDSMTVCEKALYMAEVGSMILPIHGFVDGECTCGVKHAADSNSIAKHPVISSWPEKATSDPTVVGDWLNGRPDTNYGIFCEGSGYLVLDIDVRHGGWESFELLDKETGYCLPATVEVETGLYSRQGQKQRGAHKYYRLPPGYTFPANLKRLGCPGIDIKVDGYVLGPGSRHKSGATYEFKAGHAPWEIALAELPKSILEDIARKGKRQARSERKSPLGDGAWESRWAGLLTQEVTNTPYAEKALFRSCSEIKRMVHGEGRNNALNAKAYSLGRLIGGGQLSFVDCRQRLMEAARTSYKGEWAYKQEAVELVLREWGGGFEIGAIDPKYPNSVSEEMMDYIRIVFGVQGVDKADELIETLHQGFFDTRGSLQQLTLQAVIQQLGPIALGVGKQLWRYHEGVWKNDGEEEVIRRTQLLLGEESRRNHTDNVLHFMKAAPIAIDGLGPTEYLNCKNGMLRLDNLTLHSHSPDYWSTVQLDTSWNPEATCPTVDEFLSEMVYEDTIELIWEVIGVCIFLGLGPQRGVFLRGSGRNGKGTLLRLIRAMIPAQFVASIEIQKLSTDTFAAAELFGKILNVVGDLSPKALEDTALFKMLTGEDAISAQRKYGHPFTFTSQATLLFAANQLPQTPDITRGFFSRMLIIPMDKKTIHDGQADKTLEPRMHEELPGVLVKAVSGLRRVLDRGSYPANERCERELEAYMNPLDTVEAFSDSRLHFTGLKSDRINRKEMYEDYEFFCITNGMAPLDRGTFVRIFVENNVHTTRFLKSSGNWVFNGVRVVPELNTLPISGN
jgi:putative DNA primase/helicase